MMDYFHRNNRICSALILELNKNENIISNSEKKNFCSIHTGIIKNGKFNETAQVFSIARCFIPNKISINKIKSTTKTVSTS